MALRIIMSSPAVRLAGAAARLGAGRHGLKYRTAAGAALEPEPPAAHRVGRGFIALYALAYMSTSLLFVAPLLVTLPLKRTRSSGSNRHRAAWRLLPGSVPCWRWWAIRCSAR
ncbi:MAG TPA: hypothetical protein VHS32_04560 [Streptosporangiaceae bacterium]|jgi:hypothetical protein|nr:hypothetical protein [Streptosporangiaceae bacterium]